ncbi:MAG: hypothetical protein WA639_00660 [Candidatus Acidiferrum sp.]
MLVIVVTAVAVLFYPYEIPGVPEWRLQILDSGGNAMAGVPVNEDWLDPVDEGNSSGDQRQTDSTGTVLFPKRVLHNQLEFGFLGVKAHARIQVCAKGEFGSIYWEGSAPLPKTLKLQNGSCPYD